METTKEKEVYKETYDLFNGCCALCGSPYIMMHHIRFGGLRGGRKTYMGNVIPLCLKHHQLVHTNKVYYMEKLIKIIDEKMGEKI